MASKIPHIQRLSAVVEISFCLFVAEIFTQFFSQPILILITILGLLILITNISPLSYSHAHFYPHAICYP
jgi:hypothetical protein